MRIDRERARRLSDAQVIDAYGRVFPESVGRLEGLAAAAWAQRIAVWRERLWNVSWYMRCLNEWIARQANREDGCTGRFWEGRFRSQALLDAGAVLTCMCYVDLNPLRAGVAETLEAADFTSIQERLLLAGEREQETRAAVFPRGGIGRRARAVRGRGGSGRALWAWIPPAAADAVRRLCRLAAGDRQGDRGREGGGADHRAR